jgi:hypothetical protein
MYSIPLIDSAKRTDREGGVVWSAPDSRCNLFFASLYSCLVTFSESCALYLTLCMLRKIFGVSIKKL